MKKIIITILFFISVFSIFSQNVYSIADRLDVNFGNGYIGWIPVSVVVFVDTDDNIISIESKEYQEFILLSELEIETDEYTLITHFAKDIGDRICKLELYFYRGRYWYMKIIYKNITYKYRLKYGKN